MTGHFRRAKLRTANRASGEFRGGVLSSRCVVRLGCVAVLAFLAAIALQAAELSTRSSNALATPWTSRVEAIPLPEYPRPQFQRDAWINLNGSWDYAIRPRDFTTPPASYDGKLLVPFAIESQLGGPGKNPNPDQRLWYHRTIDLPESVRGKRLLLHFGAVNWQTDVWVNGKQLGRHEGGYDPFSFDITNLLVVGRPQEIVLAVWNPVDTGAQPRGKQVLNPANIFYTSVTGIWQTVWLEPLPMAYVQGVQISPNLDRGTVAVSFKVVGSRGAKADVRILAAGQEVARTEITAFDSLIDYCSPIEITVPNPHRWSPDDPFLYDVEVTYTTPRGVDRVKSYFGFRKVERKIAADGYERIFLNGQSLFLYGPLDQGWWPDGLYTAPTDEALRWDVEAMKKMSFNMVRKHVKIEPARWYYHCDKLGLLVWQDMPSAMQTGNPAHQLARGRPIDGIMDPLASAQFRRELENMVDNLRHHPSIIAWVPFNEGWGQHNTNEILHAVKQLDPTRLVDGPSGWNDLGYGDLLDKHDYPGPSMFMARSGRVSVLGEFGGLGLPITGHLWQQDKNWGYRDFGSAEELVNQYEALLDRLGPLIDQGLAAAVYTQFTDVEGEVNGLVTYDRQVIKIPMERLAELHHRLTKFQPASSR